MGNECYELWGKEFYDIMTMKIRLNWKYNWTVSFMVTTNHQKQQENQQTIQLSYTMIASK